MKILVWQWGRRGAGPRYAAELAASLRRLAGVESVLSLSAQSEILAGPTPPPCELPVLTYTGLGSFLLRLPLTPFQIGPLAARLCAFAPDLAICAMPAALDLLMAKALERAGIPMMVVVHDADVHPGDGFPMQMTLQRLLVRRARGLIALTAEVGRRLHAQDLVGDRPLIMTSLPPLTFGPRPPHRATMTDRFACSPSAACCHIRVSICWPGRCGGWGRGRIWSCAWLARALRVLRWQPCASCLG